MMTQDEIIRMAMEAGFVIWSDTSRKGMVDWACEYDTELERFAALVAEPWIETNKALANEIIELKKQAEQSQLADASLEPVGYVYEKDVAGIGMRKDVAFTKHVEVGTDLYAAPVRTKDLTPHEITDLIREGAADGGWQGFAQRVIAADREKNK